MTKLNRRRIGKFNRRRIGKLNRRRIDKFNREGIKTGKCKLCVCKLIKTNKN